MRSRIPLRLALALAAASVLPRESLNAAQQPLPRLGGIGPVLDGVWEGVFEAGGDTMPIVFTITTAQDKTAIVVDILSQNVSDIPVAAASLDGARLHMDVSALEGVFDGTVASDRTLIQGTWTQLGKRIPLTVKRRSAGGVTP